MKHPRNCYRKKTSCVLPVCDNVTFTRDIQVDQVDPVTKWWQHNGDKVGVLCDDWSRRVTNQDTGDSAKVSDVNAHHLTP